MKLIHVELQGKFYMPKIVEGERIGVMWRITEDSDGRRVPYKCRPDKLIPYTDEVWEEAIAIRAEMKALWERRLALREFTVVTKSRSSENQPYNRKTENQSSLGSARK